MGRLLGSGKGCSFRAMRGVHISYQNRNANGAWLAALQPAKHLQVAIHVEFHRRHDEGAAHPGENPRMSRPA